MKTILATIVLAAALAASGQNASADSDDAIKVTVGRTYSNTGNYQNTTFTLINGPRPYKSIKVQCALLDANKRPLAVDFTTLENVGAGATVYGEVMITVKDAGASANCRVEDAR